MKSKKKWKSKRKICNALKSFVAALTSFDLYVQCVNTLDFFVSKCSHFHFVIRLLIFDLISLTSDEKSQYTFELTSEFEAFFFFFCSENFQNEIHIFRKYCASFSMLGTQFFFVFRRLRRHNTSKQLLVLSVMDVRDARVFFFFIFVVEGFVCIRKHICSIRCDCNFRKAIK